MKSEKMSVGAEATAKRTGTIEGTESKKSFEELLQDKDYQSAFDKKIAQSLRTARTKWEENNKNKQTEEKKIAKMIENQKMNYELEKWKQKAKKAEKQNAINNLKIETIKQANEKGIPLEFINIFNFRYETPETIENKLKILENTIKNK